MDFTRSACGDFLEMCEPMRLEILGYLEGCETKILRVSCKSLGTSCDEKVLLGEFAALGNQPSPSHANIHKALQVPSLSNREAYNVAYNHARRLGCGLADVLCETDELGRTPMHIAVRASKHQAMELMLHYGAPANAGNISNGWSPLLLACWLRDMEAIKMLIAHGADVDQQCFGESGFTPLAAAAASEDLGVCKLLLAAGANPGRAEYLMSRSASKSKDDIIRFIRKATRRPLSILGDRSCVTLLSFLKSLKLDQCPSFTSGTL
jgi:hypothetical protein